MSEPLRSRYFTVPELAQELGRCTETLARWRKARRGPPYAKIGQEILYPKAGVQTWLEAQAVAA